MGVSNNEFKRLRAILMAVAVAALGFPVAPQAQDSATDSEAINSTEALKAAESGVYRIAVSGVDYYGQEYLISTGSGFLIAPGRILTNRHVINVPSDTRFYSYNVYAIPNRTTGLGGALATVVATSSRADIALLSVNSGALTPLMLATDVNKSDPVHAMGYPGVTDRMLNRSSSDMLTPSDAVVTNGEVSLLAERNPIGEDLATIFHTAPINHGNSGGPLINECGQVVGINTWGASVTIEGDSINANAGTLIATRASVIKSFLDEVGVAVNPISKRCFAKTAAELAHEAQLRQVRAEERLASEADRNYERDQNKAFQSTTFLVFGVFAALLLGVVGFLGWSLKKARDPKPLAITPDNTSATPTESALDTPKSETPVTQKITFFGTSLVLPSNWHLWAAGAAGVCLLAIAGTFILKPKPTSFAVNCRPSSWQGDTKPNNIEFLFEPTRQCRNAHEFFERATDGGFVRVTGDGPHSFTTLSSDMTSLTIKSTRSKLGSLFGSTFGGLASPAASATPPPETCPITKAETERFDRNAEARNKRERVQNAWVIEPGTVYSCTSMPWR